MKVLDLFQAMAQEPQVESNLSPSKTEADQSLTPREIAEKYARGHPLPQIRKQPLFTGDAPDLKHLDLVEISQVTENMVNLEKSHKNLENEIISSAKARKKQREENSGDNRKD